MDHDAALKELLFAKILNTDSSWTVSEFIDEKKNSTHQYNCLRHKLNVFMDKRYNKWFSSYLKKTVIGIVSE